VPASLSSPSPSILDASDPRASTAYVPPREIKLPVSIYGHSTAEGRMKWTVRRGQTLAIIADSNSVSVDDIKRWNHLTSTRLSPGQRLRIRSDSSDVTLSSEDSTKVANLRLPKRHHRSHHHRSYRSPGVGGAIVERR
jgi:LysM repeat protein